MRSKPNIIVILADDMGFGDVGCLNSASRIPTPNMDGLARQGVRCLDAHSPSAVCTPSRYGLLTGQYCWRTSLKQGVIGGYAPPLIDPSQTTIMSMLKQAGYNTACIGKWHLGLHFQDANGQLTVDEQQVDFTKPVLGGPIELGFDECLINAGCGTCASPYGFIDGDRFIDTRFEYCDVGETTGPVGVGGFGQWPGMAGDSWVTKDADVIIADRACQYIADRRDDDSPFFMYITPNAPHEPCLERFVPEFARGQSDAGARGDLVWLFDWIVGRIVQTVEQIGQTDNTLIIVTSDNGALPGDFVLDAQGQRVKTSSKRNEYKFETYGHRSNGDWRGYKAHIWEGGHREPLLARWPGHIPAGSESHQLIGLNDIMATCAAIVGYDLPNDAGPDSVDMLPALTGQAAEPARNTLIHHSSFGTFSVRHENWKLILGTTGSGGWPTPRDDPPDEARPGQLYNITDDPGEENNLFASRADIVQQLTDWLDEDRNCPQSAACRPTISSV